jgi:peptidoglycan/LPS O-acetylase OafA/YrhL
LSVGAGPLPNTRGRFRQVDAMRALAALSVVYYHVAFRFPRPGSATSAVAYLSQRNAGPPITAVVLFFVISGFVLYRPFVRARFDGDPPPAPLPYALRRFARIVPGYWVALAIVSAWLGYSYVFSVDGFLRYFCFTQLYGNAHTLNGGISVAWSLCVEITFYIAVPLLAASARRLGRRTSLIASELQLCAAMVAISLAWQVLLFATLPNSNTWRLSLLPALPGSLELFAAGMLLAVFSVDYERRSNPRAWAGRVNATPAIAWIGALALIGLEGWLTTQLHGLVWWIVTNALKLLACALLLAPLALGPQERGLLRRVLGSRAAVWLGTISYGIYLWHYPLLIKLGPSLTRHGELYTVVVIAALSAAAGALSYYLVERPAQNAARTITRHLTPGVA